jgi:DNA-binding GntR family transcriptional regulator
VELLEVGDREAEQLDAIRRSLAQMDAVAGIDLHAWEEAHRRFHQRLVAHAGSRLVRLVEQLSDHPVRYRRAYIAGDYRLVLRIG